MDELGVDDVDEIRVLTLRRPERRNALTVELVASLTREVEKAGATGPRGIVITGASPAFCAGGDLDDLSRVADQGAMQVARVIYSNFHGLVRALAHSDLPVVAAVNGAALGAGLDLALACDLRVCAASATFASTWVKVGLVPGMGGAYRLPGLIGATRAAEVLLLGGDVDATQAATWGLVNDVVADDQVLDRATQLAARAAELPREAVAATKASLRRAIDAGLDNELAALGGIQGGLLTGPDFQQMAQRFRR